MRESAPPTGGKAAEANTKDHKGLKGSGKGGKAKKGDADAKLQKAKEQSAEDVTADSTAAPAPSAAELLKEATEVIRSLKLKALVLKVQHGNSVCEDVKNAAEAVCGTGLLDTGASTSMRQAKPGELDEECELRTVNLAIGTVKLFVNSGGTLLSEEDIDPLVSVADLVEMGCKLSWSGNECVLRHPDRGTIRPSTLNKCPEVSRDFALELIADIEAHRQAQRIMIRALRDEAESLSIRDAAVLQNKLCSSARAGLKVGALMYSWLCHKFEGTPVGLLDNLALRSNCATDGALVKWNRRVRRACERDGAFVAVGQPKAVKDAAKPCVVLEVDLEELCEPPVWRYLLTLAAAGKLRGMVGTAPGGFDLGGEAALSHRDDVTKGRQALAIMALLEVAACGFEPLFCMGRPIPEEAGVGRFMQSIHGRRLRYVVCQGTVGLWTNAELPLESVWDAPQPTSQTPEWDDRVRRAVSDVVASAVRLQVNLLSEAAQCRVAVGRPDATFKRHLAQDHLPWRRDCRHCVEGGIQSRMHRRIKTPEGFTLSLDLLGKYEKGFSEHHPEVVWCLVGCFTVPELAVKTSEDEEKEKVELDARDLPDPLLPSDVEVSEYEPSIPEEEPLIDGGLDGLWSHEEEAPMEWERPGEDLRGSVRATKAELEAEDEMSREWVRQEKEQLEVSKMYELPFVVPLPNKNESTVVDGIALILTQLQAMGYTCVRVHSDKGREFANQRLRSFLRLRGIYKTTSEGDAWKENGRVEGLINRVKRQARVLIAATGVEYRYWPFALQHVAARMRANLSPILGGPEVCVLPFGTKVYVRNRRWNRKGQRWAARGLVGTVLAPSVEVTKGHVVLLSDGRLMITTTLLTDVVDPGVDPSPLEGDMQPLRRDLPFDARPAPVISHRIPKKRAVRATRDVTVALRDEDTAASRLATDPKASLEDLRHYVLQSRWLRTSRPRSRGEVLRGGCDHTLGFFRHGGVLGITSEHRLFPGFVALLSRIMRECAPEATWTTLAVLADVQSEIHRDKNNLPESYNVVVPLSVPDVGGGVWRQTDGGSEMRHLKNGKAVVGEVVSLRPLVPVHLDARRYHATEPWEKGTRVVLVGYSLKAILRADPNTVDALQRSGFVIPEQAVRSGTRRSVTESGRILKPTEAVPGKKLDQIRKLDHNDRADVRSPVPVWTLRYTILEDEEAAAARRRGVRRPRFGWINIQVAEQYGWLGHVRHSPISAFALSLYLARERDWTARPRLEVIWDQDGGPWLLGYHPTWLTEDNTNYELDRLGTVYDVTRIAYEDVPNLAGYLFRAAFGDEGRKWYFLESAMHLQDRFLSSEAVGRTPIPNPQDHTPPPHAAPRVAMIRAESSWGEPRPASGAQVPQSEQASGAQVPQSEQASGAQVPQSKQASGAQVPQSEQASGAQVPQPEQASGAQAPQSKQASGALTLQSRQASAWISGGVRRESDAGVSGPNQSLSL